MSKKLNKRQLARIQNKNDENSGEEARVISHLGFGVLIEYKNELLLADWRQNLGDIACNDRVLINLEPSPIINKILPRENCFYKWQGRKEKVIASHINQILLVLAIEPEWQENFLDRYLIAAAEHNLPLLLFINKCDLGTLEIERRLSAYPNLNYLCGSVYSGENIPELSASLAGKTTLICGQSGVGKSSLINKLCPQADAWIQAISEFSSLGKHTTTNIRLYPLDDGGALIDTAGVRGLQVTNLSLEAILRAYPEIANAANSCKFNDCQHLNEPDCAVRSALERGQIAEIRYQNFLQIKDEFLQNNKNY